MGGSGGARRDSRPRPTRRKIAFTVESAIESSPAISAAVMRTRLSATTACTRLAGVRCGIRPGA
ncbi:MAG: hypothetical protein ACRDPP_02360, partial [Gaiellaceae bacterium]